MTRIRVISAAVGALGLITLAKFGGYTGLSIAAFVTSFALLLEYARMALDGDRYKTARYYFIVVGLIVFTISIFKNDMLLHSIVLSVLLFFIHFLLLARDEAVRLEELTNKAGLSVMGILYAGACPVYICLLAKLSPHLEWFIFTFVVVFTGDTAAYFVGRQFGKTRLFKRISPKKSIEGAIASLFASVAIGMTVRNFLLPQTDMFLMLSLCILTSIAAQLGDLCESLVKRSFRTKDSGQIMPGHGGLLDRLDGVLFGAPVVYIFAKFLILGPT